MSKAFEKLQAGMADAIAYHRGEKKTLTARDVELLPPPKLTAKAIIRIRTVRLHASQTVFARMLNVSPNTVRAWEGNRREPDSAALRLLQIADRHPEVFMEHTAP